MAREPRYFVDDRTGCVAVRDRRNTDPEDQGLWPDTKGVIQFWSKKRVFEKCPACGHKTSDWSDGDEQIKLASELAVEMNREGNLPPA